MAGVLAALGTSPSMNTGGVCAAVFPSWGPVEQASTRRALRRLAAQGLVYRLGCDLSGAQTWCLRERRHLFGKYGELLTGLTLGDLFGNDFMLRGLRSAGQW
jgi:hypothetical protein